MKTVIKLSIVSFLFNLTSCNTTYQMIASGESFDALTKITDDKKVCFSPNGGDNNKNIVFCGVEEDGSYNLYIKDNVLSSAIIQKTSGQNINLNPSYCNANEKIVFQYWTKTNFDIYYINAKGGKAITQITNSQEDEFNPSWSPDGKMIVFEKGATPKSYVTYTANNQYVSGVRVTENQIWIKNIETGELKMIGNGSFPKFSPDGKDIAYIKYDLNKSQNAEIGTLWTMSIEGDNQKQITGIDLGYALCPNWSPDGKNLVFELIKKDKSDADIYTISVNGDDLKQHTTNTSRDFSPYWSTDNYIYFCSDRGSHKKQYLIWRFKVSL
jgi:Tol biopolymer transport system component